MGFYEERVLPRVVELTCGGKRMEVVRRPALDGLAGTVVELGFGSGTNVGLYPPAVERVLAVEPSELARARAAKRIAGHPEPPVEFVGLDGAHLALDAASVDAVLSTWTLCTIPDVERAIDEVRRVLRPGGELHFLDHGLSDDPRVARWQHRLEPIQKRLGGGCHLTRDPAGLVRGGGLRIVREEHFRLAGPRVFTTMTSGVAVKDVG
ncbi:MAG: class I SAM-dependent methyltransferase [Actinobacteria bacterium]|nr:class I SAM-dependent methyltransferase [Actinomycetota bacterium]